MAIQTNGQGNGLTMDLRSLDRLKTATGKDPKSGVKEAARQLESLFMQELVKSMRATTMDTGMLDNSGSEMGTSMLDTQLSQKLSGLPGGLSELIEKQLSKQMGLADKSFQNTAEAQQKAQALTADNRRASHTEAFVRKHQAAAKAAEDATGIPASNILGQAALESGWGKHEIKAKDGSSSHNLFGIKATSDWKGKVAEVTTTEYIGGVARKVTAKFRAYDSYEEAFKDHARLLTKSPRYSQTVAQADTAQGYAQGLQKAGYATDPAYADKLTKVINTTLRLQRGLT